MNSAPLGSELKTNPLGKDSKRKEDSIVHIHPYHLITIAPCVRRGKQEVILVRTTTVYLYRHVGCNSVNDREKEGKEGNEMKVSVDEAPHNVAWVVFE